eukprot:SAG31_NODE_3_length_45830_cov_42.279701_1_plen_132_part_00
MYYQVPRVDLSIINIHRRSEPDPPRTYSGRSGLKFITQGRVLVNLLLNLVHRGTAMPLSFSIIKLVRTTRLSQFCVFYAITGLKFVVAGYPWVQVVKYGKGAKHMAEINPGAVVLKYAVPSLRTCTCALHG